jgi:hypothetical protein
MDDTDLVIRCRHDDQVFELVPDLKLTSALPRSLIRNYTHWYNLKSHIMEIRPLSDPWTPNLAENWSTAVPLKGSLTLSRQLEPGRRQFLVNPNHSICRAIHKVFSPLEPSRHDFTITFDYGSSTNHKARNLTISLPRYNLVFALTEQGDLECLSHRGYLVDPNQDIGTLYGLSNMLVLRHSTSSHKRSLILPVGVVHQSSSGNSHGHPHVTITVDPIKKSIRYNIYEVDDLLGRLRDTTLLSRLYRLYLHALTSHQLVDPLLGCTGTEEAFQGLAQGETFSFQTLHSKQITVLKNFELLTPNPYHSFDLLETFQWNALLPATDKHHTYQAAVRKILDYWASIRPFYVKGPERHAKEPSTHQRVRNAREVPSLISGSDMTYAARDCLVVKSSIDNEAEAYKISKLVHEWLRELDVTRQLSDVIRGWGGVSARQPRLSLNYSSTWVSPSLHSTWRSLYELCRHASKDDRERLAFVLATIAYHHPTERQICRTLLAFATNDIFKARQHDSPNSGNLDFSYGEIPTETGIRLLVSRNTIPFNGPWDTPEVVEHEYNARLQQQVNSCVDIMMGLCEQDHVSFTELLPFYLLEQTSLHIQLNNLFKNCYQNR